MPITIPKTWGSEVLNASDVNNNTNAIKEGVALTDGSWWTTGKFIEAKHVVKPYIESTQNASHHVSGWYCSQNSGSLYTAGSFVSKFEANINDRMIIPKTSITIPLMKPATIFYQFWATSESRSDEDGTRGALIWNAYFVSKDTVHDSKRQLQKEQYWDSAVPEDGSIISGREFLVLFNSRTVVAADIGDFIVGVSGYPNTGNATAQLLSWGFTVECFYI